MEICIESYRNIYCPLMSVLVVSIVLYISIDITLIYYSMKVLSMASKWNSDFKFFECFVGAGGRWFMENDKMQHYNSNA